ncbi:DNA polymerase III subunit delta' [Flavobacterium sp. CBA20B-1]|uniref:DNA polymerase III subunit n=1 Tax=unclassified Flavobacterium TaxID=196869 RepID=UPI002224084C|nr:MULTISPECIES: DNA polymerase III subunit delta' [unclassified Flavobacterium]WCM41410.1 DNA polymerase III subunit delta' [Flavobacterium sp. CBA20B-1]
MKFSEIVGQNHLKNHLTNSVQKGRIPHAQLFIGPEGSGTLAMAIAYAQYIICNNQGNENEGGATACNLKFDHLQHPDLHFVYPVATTDSVKSTPVSSDFLTVWNDFIKQNLYGSVNDWYEAIGIQKKQGNISVHEAASILKKLALKPFEGGYKVMIVWMAEKMNTETANKLLKILEEPTEKTIFLLIAEDEKALLQTIVSRCQVLHFTALNEQEIFQALIDRENCDEADAYGIAKEAQGNYNKALKLRYNITSEYPFDEWFVTWVRAAFRANKNARVVNDLIKWSDEISAIGREKQKQFLNHCMELFRQALLLNYSTPKLVYMQPKVEGFNLQNFAPFVNENNILDIYKEIEDAIYHIERNGNAKIILTDLSIKLTRLIHKK